MSSRGRARGAGDAYVSVIGADVARRLLAAGVLDEVVGFVAPVMLGDGVRPYELPGGANMRLEPVRVTRAPPTTGLWLRVAWWAGGGVGGAGHRAGRRPTPPSMWPQGISSPSGRHWSSGVRPGATSSQPWNSSVMRSRERSTAGADAL